MSRFDASRRRLCHLTPAILVAAAVLPLQSCTDSMPAGPNGIVGESARRTTAAGLGTYNIPIAYDNGSGAVESMKNTGIIIPAGTYYRIRVNGTVVVSPNPAHMFAYPGYDYSGAGTYGPGGRAYYSELKVNLAARNTNGSGSFAISLGTVTPDSSRSDIAYTSTELEIQAGRNGIAGATNDNCCH